jgi:2-oxoglutarate/2-oxoacid ferredoxin oxidoreductase subunit alpha
MALGDLALEVDRSSSQAVKCIANDFSMIVATINGSGSQLANNVLMKSIFAMGVPVSGKNLFPSNIAGLSTWFIIRASKDGYLARKRNSDVLIALNPDSVNADFAALAPGSVVIYEENLKIEQMRNDLILYPVPFDKITATVCPEAKRRKQVKNMVYVGVAAQLFSIDLKVISDALADHFGNKPAVIELNFSAVKAGYEYAEQNLTKQDSFCIEPMNENVGKVVIDGNDAAAMGALFAGVTVVAWYPITPSTSTIETIANLLKKYRKTSEGKATYAVVQAEDELAAIGTVLGAGWAGARSMTATSGPGMSLMAEFVGLGYYTELPGVILNVQRTGPSTGLPTRTQQADVLSAAFLSHGDTKNVLLFPGSVKECFEHTYAAFDLAERLQTPVFVLSDLDLGMNQWVSDAFDYPTKPLDRGKVLTAEDLEKLGSFARYRDVDGDAIGWRTLPGTMHPKAAYFTRGSGHNDQALYSEKPADYEAIMQRLARKFDTARTLVPKPEIVRNKGAKVGFIAYGSTDFAMRESLDQIAKEYGVEADYLRVRAYPFTQEVHEFVAAHEKIYVVEQNRDAQLASLLKLDLTGSEPLKLNSILHYNGWPVDARTITDAFAAKEVK